MISKKRPSAVLLLASACLALSPIVTSAEAPRPFITASADVRGAILQSKRIVFLGDSITANAGYVIGVAQALHSTRLPNGGPEVLSMGLSSETVSGLSEEGHGGAGEKAFPRPYLFDRLDSILDLTKPDTVFACYGMNCGIYKPLSQERFERFKEGIERLHAELEKRGARIVHITPPFYDVKRRSTSPEYPEVLLKYAEWLVSKREAGWQVIDLHTAMKAEVEKRRESVPDFTMSPDGIHPNPEGHWLMACQILGWLGETEAATAPSAAALLESRKVPATALALISKRVSMMRDSLVHAAGHKRPGVAVGLPVETARAEAQKMDAELSKLRSP